MSVPAFLTSRLSIGCGALILSLSASAASVDYYVGVDKRSDLTFGDFAGLANPNNGRLTWLLAHGNHYHGIGTYSYSADQPGQVLDTNANNRLPEGYTAQPPLSLVAGTGPLYGDKLVVTDTPANYDNLSVRSVDELAAAPPDSEDGALFNSSNGGWTTSLAGSQLLLQLVSISEGLNVGSITELNLFDDGVDDTWNLGDGDTLDIELVLWAERDAAPGVYSVGMQLIDANGLHNPSGTFFFDTQVGEVPLPPAVVLLGSALLVAARRRGRRGAAGATGRRR